MFLAIAFGMTRWINEAQRQRELLSRLVEAGISVKLRGERLSWLTERLDTGLLSRVHAVEIDCMNLIKLRALHPGRLSAQELPSPLPELKNLEWLNLSGTWVRDLRPWSTLPNLKHLQLCDTDVKDLAPLARLNNLVELNLDNTDVQDLTPLRHLPNLQVLNLSNTTVNSLAPLEYLSELKELVLSNTDVGAPRPRLSNESESSTGADWHVPPRKLPPLRSDGKSLDITPLENLGELRALNLSGTAVNDLSPLVRLTSLRQLNLGGCPVVDVSQLAPLKNLSIFGGPIENRQSQGESHDDLAD